MAEDKFTKTGDPDDIVPFQLIQWCEHGCLGDSGDVGDEFRVEGLSGDGRGLRDDVRLRAQTAQFVEQYRLRGPRDVRDEQVSVTRLLDGVHVRMCERGKIER